MINGPSTLGASHNHQAAPNRQTSSQPFRCKRWLQNEAHSARLNRQAAIASTAAEKYLASQARYGEAANCNCGGSELASPRKRTIRFPGTPASELESLGARAARSLTAFQVCCQGG